jgi:hypothetical protein
MADHFVAASGPRVSVKITTGVGGMPPVWFVAIAARNSGCLGTEVQQFGLQPPNGRHVQNIYDFLGQPVQLPMSLGPGGTATMTYPPKTSGGYCVSRASRGRTSGPTSTRATGDSRGSQSAWASASPNL